MPWVLLTTQGKTSSLLALAKETAMEDNICPKCKQPFDGVLCKTCTVGEVSVGSLLASDNVHIDKPEVDPEAPTAFLVDLVSNRKIPVTVPRCRVGRDDLNDIVISGDQSISRFHFIITRENGQYFVQDAKSRHGTFLNGNQITAGPEIINDGDVLKIGVSLFWFVIETAVPEPAQPVSVDAIEKKEIEVSDKKIDKSAETTTAAPAAEVKAADGKTPNKLQRLISADENDAENEITVSMLLGPLHDDIAASRSATRDVAMPKMDSLSEPLTEKLSKKDEPEPVAEEKPKSKESAKSEEKEKEKEKEKDKAKSAPEPVVSESKEAEPVAKSEPEKAPEEPSKEAEPTKVESTPEPASKEEAEKPSNKKDSKDESPKQEEASKSEEPKAEKESKSETKSEKESKSETSKEEAKGKKDEPAEPVSEDPLKEQTEEEKPAPKDKASDAKEEQEDSQPAKELNESEESPKHSKESEEQAAEPTSDDSRTSSSGQEEGKSGTLEKFAGIIDEVEHSDEQPDAAEPTSAAEPKGGDSKVDTEIDTSPTGFEEETSNGAKTSMTSAVQESSTVPDWTKKFFSVELKHLNTELEELNEQVRSAQQRIKEVESRVSMTKGLRNTLLASQGDELVEACGKILTLLGWKVKISDEDKSEIRLVVDQDEKNICIARVIRTKGQAERSHLGQLSISQTRHWMEQSVEPKGILIISKVTDGEPTPLSNSDLNSELADYAAKKNVCLMTTLQLLALYKEVALAEAKPESLRTSIMTGNGWLSGYSLEPGEEEAKSLSSV